MTFKDNAQLDTSHARGSGKGKGIVLAGGGGIGTLLLVGLYLLMGGSPQGAGDILMSNQGTWQDETASGETSFEHCQTGADAMEHADCLLIGAGNFTDKFWTETLPVQFGAEYTRPYQVIFQGSTNSGCGQATSATGPFYCSADTTSYYDTSFFSQLEQLGGSAAPLAQMYIVAHEIGHHVQTIEGTIGQIDYNDPGPESMAVKMELQADCYAGMALSSADDGENAMLEPITPEQVQAAIDTARAVGDDNIQRYSGQGVRPDAWTHGSSEQRQEAFLTGYEKQSMAACDYPGFGHYRG
ncbi:KPN_02809 family neutral zinc metallopeptidase [Corynebacterium uterequi]|uniref:Putative metalloprotease n=1 Tax=Corynebacterium uterequi TaxID=1072256 RepID=A0A0G3HCX8_9CORY|nr:neutral zinc metallopeptidase [Corynebacterium uterequi]AKK11216.1 putative metalloprotease [Corynebacterium uterequi]